MTTQPRRLFLFVFLPVALVACALLAAALTRGASHAAPTPAPAAVAPARGPLDAAMLERMGVRFAPAARTASTRSVDVVGALGLDREHLAEVSTHAAGRVVRIDAMVGR